MKGDSMGREIKFRAWEKTVGDYVKLLSIDFKNKTAIVEHWECGVSNPISLDNLVIERCTGLKDCYGNAIYENDIVELDPDDDPYKVIFDEGKFEIVGNEVNYDLGEKFMDCEVVGNIHENGDLLEADK